jgi:DNA-binding transcriptional MerR regulator
MRIGEIAQRSGVAPSRIRFYEANGLLPKPRRSDNGYRDYPACVLETLNLIDQARNLGFTLGEIKSTLTQGEGKRPTKQHMLVALRDKLVALNRHIKEVTRRRQQVIALIKTFEACH